MSVPSPPPSEPPGGPLTTSLVVIGIMLMLPGACSLIFMAAGLSGLPGLKALWTLTFVLAAAGIALIGWLSIRHR